jgi:hypothetical protein
MFINQNDFVDWQSFNVKIGEEKERVDKVIRQVYKQRQYIDVLAVFDLLNEQEEKRKASIIDRNSRSQVKNGSVKKRLGSAIKELQTAVQLTTRRQATGLPYRKRGDLVPVEETLSKEALKRERFFNQLKGYLEKEASATNQITIARQFVTYLEEGTTICFGGLKRHYRIFDFMINNPIVIEDISDAWVRKLIEWLKIGMRGKPLNCNTADWLFGRFQCFWTWALENNLINKRIYWKRFSEGHFQTWVCMAYRSAVYSVDKSEIFER